MESKNVINVEEAIKLGIREGIRYVKQIEYSNTEKRYDRRLRNTRLLLKHYRDLHIHESITDNSFEDIEECNAIDILDDIDVLNEENYIQSISRTRNRTKIIIQHIDKALKYYEAICSTESKKRKYNIVYDLYIAKVENNVAPTYEDIAKKYDISIKTVTRDMNNAIEDLSILFFGIDGIKL